MTREDTPAQIRFCVHTPALFTTSKVGIAIAVFCASYFLAAFVSAAGAR